jgi:bacillithiol biosynthesis cysteine-adding enzyme BshC
MNWISFDEFSSEDAGFSKLFLDYIKNYDSLQTFFSGNYQKQQDWEAAIQRVGSHHHDRSKITQILSIQNRDFQCGVLTLANIDLLANDNTFAVVTGQQVGLFGGPLYTFYKALGAIKLAEKLSADFPDCRFVPVFWLETEDHDFEEISSINILNASNDVVTLTYEEEIKNATRNLGAVGHLPVLESIEQVFQHLQSELLPTEFTPKVLELFRSAYRPGTTLSQAFVYLLNVLLENSGMIFLDPNTPEIKHLLAPIFEKELTGVSKSCQLVVSQSERLEQNYHAQVKPRSINLFLHQPGGRFGIEPHPDGFALKGSRQHFTNEEMLDLLKRSPEFFSPNVVLRPLCQDTLLPTISYVAGPAEIAYFAQFKLLYEHFDIPEPIIYPRPSLTVIEERVQKIIDKFDLNLLQIFQEKELIKQFVTQQISDFKIEPLFTDTAGTIEESLDSLRSGLEKIDPTLVPALENTLAKIAAHLSVLKEKTAAAQARQNETALRQIDRVSDSIFPLSSLQERKINLIYFLNKYGLEFVRWLHQEIEIDRFKHQVVSING